MAYLKTSTFLANACLLLLALTTSCDQGQVQQQSKPSSAYTAKMPHPDGTGKVYMGREIAGIMGAGGGNWLERNSRQQEEDVAEAIAALPLDSSSVVADIGAGTGHYTFKIAPLVPHGRVYAVEVQQEFLTALKTTTRALGLTNVELVQGNSQSPNLPEASIDLALMVDVYHELAYPQEMLQALHKALVPDGKLLLLEYRAEDATIPIKDLHKMRVAQVNKELEANGFRLSRRENFLPIQHFLLYEKAN